MTEQELTGPLLDEVLATLRPEDPRLREVLDAAVRHLHAFVAEVGLTHAEWESGIAFLTEVGRACTAERQELILLSDTLGVSSLVELSSAGVSPGVTENTVLGPFYVAGSPDRGFGESMLEDGDPGQSALVTGRVLDPTGRPVPGATLDVWQNASNRLYAVQDPDQTPTNLRGRYTTDAQGRYALRTIRPVPYPIPDDGPVGRLLALTGRHPWRPAHIHFLVTAPGHRSVTTHVFDADSDYLDSDAVFGVRDSLVRTFAPAQDPDLDAHAEVDFVLEPGAPVAPGSV
jgi:protocatechuate 3,4-dioxygenase beta subunit